MEIATENKPLFSILIANYNNGIYIREAIESAFNQTYNNWEIIVVDDASTDDSLGVISEMSRSDARVRLFANPTNRNCGYTKRKAVTNANGSVAGFLDPDDTLTPDAIQEMVEAHLEHPAASLISASHYVCNEKLEVQREAYAAGDIPEDESYLSFGKGITAFASFKMSDYLKTEGISSNQKRAVDQDLYYKLEEVGQTVFIPKVLYYYRVHPNGLSTLNNLSKSRYWLVRAKEAAFRRRLKNPSAKNITVKELHSWWSILYATKASNAIRKFRPCKFVYWMSRSFITRPFDKYFMLKLKALFLNSNFHVWYDRWRSQ